MTETSMYFSIMTATTPVCTTYAVIVHDGRQQQWSFCEGETFAPTPQKISISSTASGQYAWPAMMSKLLGRSYHAKRVKVFAGRTRFGKLKIDYYNTLTEVNAFLFFAIKNVNIISTRRTIAFTYPSPTVRVVLAYR